TDATGQRFSLDVQIGAFPGSDREVSIIGADLRALGIDVSERVPPRGRDNMPPGLVSMTRPLGLPSILLIGVSSECPVGENRSGSSNRGCWANSQFDRDYQTLASSLDPAARVNAAVQAIRILTEDVGALGLYFTSDYVAVRHGLLGPGPRWPPQMATTWNI